MKDEIIANEESNQKLSMIADTLKLLLELRMIELVKKPGDRKKYYRIILSWDSRMIRQFKRSTLYAIEMKEKIRKWLEKVEAKNLEEER